jgi:hypothetical protein
MSSKSRYKPKNRHYKLSWPAGHELAGLEVTLRAMRLGELESMGRLMASVESIKGSDEDDLKQAGTALEVLGQLRERLGKVLVWWNRLDEETMYYNEDTEEYEETEDSKPLPATPEGLAQLEDWEFKAILSGYMTATSGVAEDLGKDSSSGEQSLEAFTQTALL